MSKQSGDSISKKAINYDLPYFDEILSRQHADDSNYQQAFSQNVHFGYWPHPNEAKNTLADYAIATDELNRQIFRVAAIANNQKVLDVGCGFGGTLGKLNGDYENMELVGLNIDARQIEVARHRCPTAKSSNQMRFVVADALSTGEPDNSFDRILAIEVIFHLPSRARFFAEAGRILKRDGILVITELVANPIRLPRVFWTFFRSIPQLIHYKETIGDLGNTVTISNYKKLAARNGFKIEEINNWSRNVLPSLSCLKSLNAKGISGRKSLYAPQLLDFSAELLSKEAEQYLAIKLRKQ